MQRIIKPLLYFGLFIAISSTAFATEVAIEVIGPQLVFSPSPILSVEALNISITYLEENQEFISVEYQIKNNSDEDWSGLMEINIPERYRAGEAEWYDDRTFSDMITTVNGMAIRYNRLDRAFWNGEDISDQLVSLGIDPNLIDQSEEIMADRTININKRSEAIKGLLTQGAISAVPYFDNKNSDFWLYPHWSVTNTYYWIQEFPANSLTTIVYTYKPLTGRDLLSADSFRLPFLAEQPNFKSLSEIFAQSCVTWLDVVKMFPETDDAAFELRWFSFFPSYIKWASPIKVLKLKAFGRHNQIINGLYISDYAAFTCINNHKAEGKPTLNIELEDVIITAPVVVLMATPYIDFSVAKGKEAK